MDLNNKNNSLIFVFSIILFLISTPFTTTTTSAATTTKIKGAYWFQDSGLPLSSINATLFTHLFASFADLNNSTFQVTVSSSNANSFSQFTPTLKQTNPNIITLLSIGGGASKPSTFSSMASSPSTRKTFINSAINAARTYSFSGLDLDYEYPATQSDMTNLGTLLSEWRAAIAAESNSTKRPPLLLTAAVFYRSDYYSLPYPASSIAKNLDFINLMAYDFWGPLWSSVTRPTAALYDTATGVSGSSGVATWIKSGVPATKLALGVPFYGYAWTLSDPDNNGYLAPTTGAALSSDGSVTYEGINEFLADNDGVTTVYNATTVESYSYVDDTWIAYDDVEAVAAKMAFVKQKGLLGYFTWHVGADDGFVLATTAFKSLS